MKLAWIIGGVAIGIVCGAWSGFLALMLALGLTSYWTRINIRDANLTPSADQPENRMSFWDLIIRSALTSLIGALVGAAIWLFQPSGHILVWAIGGTALFGSAAGAICGGLWGAGRWETANRQRENKIGSTEEFKAVIGNAGDIRCWACGAMNPKCARACESCKVAISAG